MYLKMSDFFSGMGKDFTIEAMGASTKLSQKEKDILLHMGDSAAHFYVLLKGRIKLSLGQTGPQVYMARRAGEIIGWSCLIGREVYSATAECAQPSDLLKFDRENFLGILTKYPSNWEGKTAR